MADVFLEERTFSEVKRLCCAGQLDGLALLDEVIERLRRVVPFEAYCASTKDPASGFITQALSEEMGGADDIFWALERLYFEHHQSVRRMADTHQSVALLSEITGGDLERSTRYAEYLRPLGLADEMCGAFTSGGYLWGSMNLSRESGSPDFEPREAKLLRRIAPHVGNGLKMATLRVHTPMEEGETDVPGVLTLDYQGRVVQHTPAAERWLRDLEDLGPGWRERGELPRAIRTVVLSLRRALSPERDRDEQSVPTLRARARSGRWLTLYGSMTEALGTEPTLEGLQGSRHPTLFQDLAALGLQKAQVAVAISQLHPHYYPRCSFATIIHGPILLPLGH